MEIVTYETATTGYCKPQTRIDANSVKKLYFWLFDQFFNIRAYATKNNM